MQAREVFHHKDALAARGIDFDHIVKAVSEKMAVDPDGLKGPCKERNRKGLRAVVLLDMTMTDIDGQLQIAVPTVRVAVKKGRGIARQEDLTLDKLLNVKV